MKMKAVCEKTGLTDRAVRLYIQEKLIEPVVTENYLGRKTLDFRSEDVQQLLDIAVLRKFGFSIAQIRAIQLSPESAGFVLENARSQKQDIVASNQKILDAMDKIKVGNTCTVAELADALRTADMVGTQPEDDDGKPGFLGYTRMLLQFVLVCIGFVVGLLAVMLLTDMAVFYFGNHALSITTAGLETVFDRSGVCFAWLIIAAALLVPLSYYIWIICHYGRNSRKPEVCVRAVVVDKKQNADAVVLSSFYARNGGMIGMLVFKTADGECLELTVPQRTYYLTAIGTRGELVYQGNKMLRFIPDIRTPQ